MLNSELIDYLGLVPKNEEQKNTRKFQAPKLKAKKRNFKFLLKLPVTSVTQSINLIHLSNIFEFKNDPAHKKNKYIGSDYERFLNNDNFVEFDELCNKRGLKSKEKRLSRSCRLLKKDVKKISIDVKKLSFKDILKYNISEITKDFIEKLTKKQTLNSTIDKGEDEDQAISIETRFRELAQIQLTIYNDENTIQKKRLKRMNDKSDDDILIDFSNISSENFYEKSTITTEPKNKKMRSNLKIPFQESNINNKIELIDLTEC